MTTKNTLFGLHAVQAMLDSHPERIIRLYISEDRSDKKLQQMTAQAKRLNIPVESSSRKTLSRMTDDANHQGVVALCEQARVFTENDIESLLQDIEGIPFILVLDGVQDPHNLGACFRTADAAGVHMIIAPKDKSAGLTATVSKVASGAAETIPFVQVTNLVRALELLKKHGIWIYGAAGEASQSLYQTTFDGPIAIVMGAEGEGLRRLTREHCDFLVNIPMRGTVSSLNVSVATGVILFEVVRQRLA